MSLGGKSTLKVKLMTEINTTWKHISVYLYQTHKHTQKTRQNIKKTNKYDENKNTYNNNSNKFYTELCTFSFDVLCEITSVVVVLWENVYLKTGRIQTPQYNIRCVLPSYAEFRVKACPIMKIPPSGRLMGFVQTRTMAICSTSHRQPLDRGVNGASVAKRW